MVQEKVKTVVWSGNAANQYYEIMEFLSEKAPEALSIVGNALLDLIDSLGTENNNYPSDRFKKNNDGTYKSAVVYSYRISYLISNKSVNILRIRHTSREPVNH